MSVLLTPDTTLDIVTRLITSAFGTLGFAIIMGVPKGKITAATLGGLFTSAVYELVAVLGGTPLVCAFGASIFMTLYSEIMARKMRSPAPIFFLPCAIPIVPGSGLYYTIYNILFYDKDRLFYYGSRTIGTALGIALGFAVSMTLVNGISSLIKHRDAKKQSV